MPIIKLTEEQKNKISNDILQKIFKNIQIPQTAIDKIVNKILENIDLNPIIDAVRRTIPTPKDGEPGIPGKDAQITDSLIADVTIRAIERIQEIYTPPKDGRDGRIGEQGPQGLPGRDGLVGPQGAVGFRGQKGDRGEKGDRGAPGKKGDRGLQGLRGEKGDTGEPGLNAVIRDEDLQKVIDMLNLSSHVTKDELDKIIKNLLTDLALGKHELPQVQELGGGLSGPRLINEISKVLGQSDWVNGLPSDGTLPANLDYIKLTLDTDTAPDQEGILDWNDTDYTLDINTGLGTIIQVGQEFLFLVHNGSGFQINNGDVVYPIGTSGGRVSVDFANAETHEKITGAVGVATMDIPIGGIGFVTTNGTVRGVDTSLFVTDEILWVAAGAGNDGKKTNTRPSFPNYAVQLGIVTVSDALNGEIAVETAMTPTDTIVNFFNGVFRESISFTVSSDGAAVTGTLQPDNGHDDMTMMFSDGFTMLDTSPPIIVTLTPGTDPIPQTNYIYIPQSTKVLTVSISDWPTAEHIKVATAVLRSASTTQTDGALRNQNWNDHIQSTQTNQGHMSHIAEKLRQFEAQWESGVQGSASGFPSNFYVSSTAGVIYQLHRQSFPALSMPTDDIHVVNNQANPYITVTNLNTQTLDALGNTLANSSFSFVVWGVQNKTGQQQHLMCNLPTGNYAKNAPSNAVSDALNYSVYDIPKQFQGVGFLIARFTVVLEADGTTWSLYDTEDLRGKIPNTTAGGGAGGTGVTTLTGLSDYPAAHVAQGIPRINSGGTGQDFATLLKSGTLASPPTGMYIGEIWQDTTSSATHPELRISTVTT